MKLLSILVLAVVLGASGVAAQLGPAGAAQHVDVRTGVSGDAPRPGATVTLWVDVTPRPTIHVYAPGAKDFIPVALVLSPSAGVTFQKPAYPPGVPTALAGVDERVPVYDKTFRITTPMKIAASAKRSQVLKIGAVVKYQACNDRVCYPPASLPIAWNVTVQ